MFPRSITGNTCHGVIHQDSTFEAGLHHFHDYIWPYCAWHENDKVRIIGRADSWDELLIKVAEENQDAAKWLLGKKFVLCNPKETILKLTETKVVNAWKLNPDDFGGTVVELVGGEGCTELSKILEFYGWSCTDTHPEFYWFDEKEV